MSQETHGGITGKARRAHRKTRASGRYAQQEIEDYLDPLPDLRNMRSDRWLPIGHGSEFLPSVFPLSNIGTESRDAQLELPLALPDLAPRRSLEKRPPPFGQDMESPTPTLTLGGFLYGSLLGGAAAAMILMVLSLAIR